MMRRRLVLGAIFALWAVAYVGLAVAVGPLWAGAALLGLTGVAGLAFLHRYPGTPGQRGALLGVLCFAAVCALMAVIDRAAEPWWAVAIPLLFVIGLILVSAAGASSGHAEGAATRPREQAGDKGAAT